MKRFLTVIAAFIPAIAFVVLAQPTSSAAGSSDEFTVYAHRGLFDARRTENTMSAFRHAARRGATAWETDIMLTKDHRFLLMHDPTLNRTTNCSGRVDRHEYSWLRKHCRGKRTGDALPNAGQALRFAAKKKMRLVLEIKSSAHWIKADYLRLERAVENTGMKGRVIILSFSLSKLIRLERLTPSLKSQFITDGLNGIRKGRKHFDGLNIWAKHLTRSLVRSLHDDGILVIGRDSEHPGDWRRIHASGADGLITDSSPQAVRELPRRRRR